MPRWARAPARLLVHLTAAGVCLTVPEPGQLTVMQVARLCAALRDAVFCFGRLAGPARVSASPPGVVSRARRRTVRQRFELPLPPQPSVDQLAARLAGPSATDPRWHTITIPDALPPDRSPAWGRARQVPCAPSPR
ncbi:MAG: hypothetical protein ACRDUV_09230 [Pseudonocardiaceae bacterium]